MRRRPTILFSIGLTTFILGVVPVRAEKIIFSGRDGRTVRFDFSRQQSLLPPELEEKRLDKGRSDGPAAFIPLVDPSYSPNSAKRRESTKKTRRERDWIFENAESTTSRDRKEDEEPRLFDDEENDGAMLKYMRDGEDGEQGDKRDSDRKDRNRNGGNRNTRFDRNGNPLHFQRLDPGLNSRDPLSREMQSGFTGAPGKDDTFSKFMANELRQKADVRHRREMSSFRDRLSNPFSEAGATGGGSLFGGPSRPSGESLPGVSVSFGDFKSGTLNDATPTLPTLGQGMASPGLPNAFDTRSMPIDFKNGPSFSEKREEQRKRKPISLEIRKRSF